MDLKPGKACSFNRKMTTIYSALIHLRNLKRIRHHLDSFKKDDGEQLKIVECYDYQMGGPDRLGKRRDTPLKIEH